jgi:predicted RNase H-like HicB family nuclease
MPTKVEVSRSGRWWSIAVPSLPGVYSQCRRLDQAEARAQEAIGLYRDLAPDDVEALEVVVTPPDDVVGLIEEVQRASTLAREATEVAARLRRTAAAELRDRGYPMRDVGDLLGLSHQRVSQILLQDPPGVDIGTRAIVDAIDRGRAER